MMLKLKNILSITFFSILMLPNSYGQQDAQYTQYMYNMSVINPAYATDNTDAINFGLLYRSQWVGAVGAPRTASLFGHTVISDNLEGGFSVVHDQIGDVVNDTNVFFDIAYVFQVSESSKLSLGIKGGVSFFSTDFNGFIFSDPLPDPAFAENISRVFPNVGAGAFYFTERFYFGFSVPNLLESQHLDNNSGIITQGTEALHFFATSGYVFNISKTLKWKPAFMAKSVIGAPITLDITSNFLYNEIIELGISYRLNDGISGLFNFKITPTLRIGYAYDYTISNLGRFNSGTHEVMLLFDIFKSGKGYDKSPRFF